MQHLNALLPKLRREPAHPRGKRETILLLLEEEERKLAGVPQGGQAGGLSW